jgi:hypothetical protein
MKNVSLRLTISKAISYLNANGYLRCQIMTPVGKSQKLVPVSVTKSVLVGFLDRLKHVPDYVEIQIERTWPNPSRRFSYLELSVVNEPKE